MNVCVELLTDDVWAAEDDKTGFLSVGVDVFDQLYLKELPISLPMVPMSIIKQKIRNEDNNENSTNRNMRFFDEWSIYYVWLHPPILKSKTEKGQSINFDRCLIFFW